MPILPLPNGVQLSYIISRGGQEVVELDANRPKVVLLHALCSNAQAWNGQLADPRLNSQYDFICFEAKYHGKTTGPTQRGYGYENYADELAYAMDRLGIKRAALVGETFAGCRPAIHLAIKRPELVSSLMLMSPGFYEGEPPEVKEVFEELRDMFLKVNEAIKRGIIPRTYSGRVAPAEALQAYCNYCFGTTLSQDRLEREMDVLDRQRGRCDPSHTREVFGAHMEMKTIRGIDKITQPVLLLRGSRNSTEDMASACDLWKGAFCNSSNLEFHLIHGAPSRCSAVYPNLVNRFMAGWLAKNRK